LTTQDTGVLLQVIILRSRAINISDTFKMDNKISYFYSFNNVNKNCQSNQVHQSLLALEF